MEKLPIFWLQLYSAGRHYLCQNDEIYWAGFWRSRNPWCITHCII